MGHQGCEIEVFHVDMANSIHPDLYRGGYWKSWLGWMAESNS